MWRWRAAHIRGAGAGERWAVMPFLARGGGCWRGGAGVRWLQNSESSSMLALGSEDGIRDSLALLEENDGYRRQGQTGGGSLDQSRSSLSSPRQTRRISPGRANCAP